MPIPWITHPVVVRDYLHKSALPTLPFHWDNVADKEKARISRQRGLSIAPESYRRLETVLCADTRFLETLKKWMRTLPETIRISHIPGTSKSPLTIPYPQSTRPIVSAAKWDDLYPDMYGLTECLKDAPLQTVEELLHTVYPETKEWCFDSTRNSDGTDPDADIWKELLWSNTHKKRMEPLPQPNEETSKRVLVAVQPSCVLTEQDMVDFVWALNLPPFTVPGNAYGQYGSAYYEKKKYRLWGKVWDACVRNKANYFVLTTYDHWVFGVFTPGWSMAFCSNVISGSVSDLKTDSPTATALEALTFWIASGMRLPGGFLAPKVPEPRNKAPLRVPPPRKRNAHSFPRPDPRAPGVDWDMDAWSDVSSSSAGTVSSNLSILSASDGGNEVPEGDEMEMEYEISPRQTKDQERRMRFVEEWLEETAPGITVPMLPTKPLIHPYPYHQLGGANPQNAPPEVEWIGQWFTVLST